MKDWQRITLVSFVLIGGTAYFGYWSLNQFNQVNQALDDLSASVANTLMISSSLEKKIGLTSASVITSTTTATTSSAPNQSSQSSDATGQADSFSNTQDKSPQATPPATAIPTQVELFFAFPKKGDEVYIDCIYQISWQSSTAINSLETALIDAGTRESMGPIASGLAKKNTIERDSQNLKWKVGNVWIGAYYIAVSKINGVEAEFKSKVFEINKMSKNISADEKENVCKESGGLF